jgi:hypothetical protein
MRFTARPRMGGRRAVGRRCRGGPHRDRPLMGSRPRPPPEGEGGDEIGFSRTGRRLLVWARLGGGRSERSLLLPGC